MKDRRNYFFESFHNRYRKDILNNKTLVSDQNPDAAAKDPGQPDSALESRDQVEYGESQNTRISSLYIQEQIMK